MDTNDNNINLGIDNIDCSDNISISSILNSITEINKHNYKIYYFGMLVDYRFRLNDKAEKNKLNHLKEEFITLPSDYIEFLSLTNGMSLAVNGNLYSINEIHEVREMYDFCPDNILLIGETYNSGVQIAINLSKNENECMYIFDSINNAEYFHSLNCGFTDFLNRFIVCYGSDYWNWEKTLSDIPIIK